VSVQVNLNSIRDRDIICCLSGRMNFDELMSYAIDSYLDGTDQIIDILDPDSVKAKPALPLKPSFRVRSGRQEDFLSRIPKRSRTRVLKAILRRVLPVENTETVRDINGVPTLEYAVRVKQNSCNCDIMVADTDEMAAGTITVAKEEAEATDTAMAREPDPAPEPAPEPVPEPASVRTDTGDDIVDLDKFFDTFSDISSF